MRSAKTSRWVVPAAAFALLSAGAMTAEAQQFSFGSNKIIASPGEVIEIPVVLSGVSEPVAGVNYTVRMRQSDLLTVKLGDATTFSPIADGNGSFTYADNTLLRDEADVASGAIRGDVIEVRGVLYSTTATPATFNASAPATVATISAEVSPAARGRVELELVSGIENQTGLLGVSNAAGDSLVPTGQERPAGATLFVQIRDGLAPVTNDFTDPDQQQGFVYSAPLPLNANVKPLGTADANGLSITSLADESYGTWAYDRVGRGAWRNPPGGLLWVLDWDMVGSTDGVDHLSPRMRVMPNNDFYSHETIVQELDAGDGISLVPGTAGGTIRTITPVPAFASDGISWDGMNFFFDLVQFGIGAVGESLTLPGLKEHYVDPATLGGARVVLDQVYDQTNAGVFESFLADQGGLEVQYIQDRNGLGIKSAGPLDDSGPDLVFSYGAWVSRLGQLGVTMDASKWYKVEATITGTAFNPAYNPIPRLRAFPNNSEMQVSNQVIPFLFQNDQTLPRPGYTPTTLTVWVAVPQALDGEAMNIAFELIHAEAPDDGTDQTPTLYMNRLKVTEYNAPAL